MSALRTRGEFISLLFLPLSIISFTILPNTYSSKHSMCRLSSWDGSLSENLKVKLSRCSAGYESMFWTNTKWSLMYFWQWLSLHSIFPGLSYWLSIFINCRPRQKLFAAFPTDAIFFLSIHYWSISISSLNTTWGVSSRMHSSSFVSYTFCSFEPNCSIIVSISARRRLF